MIDIDSIISTIAWMMVHPLFTVIILPIYFIPMFMAIGRSHKQQKAITVLTVFGGWTYVGWVVALAWAVME